MQVRLQELGGDEPLLLVGRDPEGEKAGLAKRPPVPPAALYRATMKFCGRPCCSVNEVLAVGTPWRILPLLQEQDFSSGRHFAQEQLIFFGPTLLLSPNPEKRKELARIRAAREWSPGPERPFFL